MIDPGKLDVREMTEAIKEQDDLKNYRNIQEIAKEIRVDILVGKHDEAKKKATKLDNMLSSIIRIMEEQKNDEWRKNET